MISISDTANKEVITNIIFSKSEFCYASFRPVDHWGHPKKPIYDFLPSKWIGRFRSTRFINIIFLGSVVPISLFPNLKSKSHSNTEVKVNVAMEDPVSRIVKFCSYDNIS